MTELVAPLALVEPFIFGALLVFLRVAGVMVGLPVLANTAIPAAFRTLLLLWVTALIYVAVGFRAVPMSVDPFILIPLVGGEFIVGAAMGFAARMLLAVTEIAGSIMGMSSGLGMARAMDPITGASMNTIGQMLVMLGLLIFMTIGGHLSMLGAVLDSYRLFPMGDSSMLPDLIGNLLLTASHMVELAFRLAAPLAVLALIVNAGLGLLVRVAPQLNLFAVGFMIVIGAGLLLLFFEVPAMTGELQDAMVGLRGNIVEGTFAH